VFSPRSWSRSEGPAGALVNDELAWALEVAAEKGGAHSDFALCAIGGLDALNAAAVGGLETVTYTARKPPTGWMGTPAEEALNLAELREAREHFRGPA